MEFTIIKLSGERGNFMKKVYLRTFSFTLKEIMSSEKWIFYFNRFNRWLFEFADGKGITIKN